MYWQDYNITYQADDLSFGAVRGASDIALPTASDLVEMGLYVMDTVVPSVMDTIMLRLASSDALFPSLIIVTDILNQISTFATIYPTLQGQIVMGLFADTQIIPTVSKSVYIDATLDSIDTLRPIISIDEKTITLDSSDMPSPNISTTIVETAILNDSTLYPSVDSALVIDLYSTITIVPDLIETLYIESNILISDILQPTITADKFIKLIIEQILNPYIVYPLIVIGLDSADSLQPMVIADSPLLKLFAEQVVNPIAIESAYIESETVTNTILYPAILTDILELSVHKDKTLLITVGTLNLIAYIFGDDSITPVLIDDAISIILQDTYLKRLDNTWDVATIYIKESDGLWSAKPIYMKQMDQTWM